tara:strand:+ start:11011 stop:11343 length:333 start_codon:yes stop_codon:yes gene_type:complete
MQFFFDDQISKAIKITLEDDGSILGRAFIYLIKNDLHEQPYALLEDVFVEEVYRGQGNGQRLVQAAIDKAKELGCYKIIGTSRHSRQAVHEFYTKLGFHDYGKEFRMDIN